MEKIYDGTGREMRTAPCDTKKAQHRMGKEKVEPQGSNQYIRSSLHARKKSGPSTIPTQV